MGFHRPNPSLASDRVSTRSVGMRDCWLGGAEKWESKPERGALCRFAGDSHGAAMPLYNVTHDVEAKSDTCPDRAMSGYAIYTIESLPDALEICFLQTRSVIAHGDPCGGAVDCDPDGYRSVSRRVLQRVREEVGDDLLDPRRIGIDWNLLACRVQVNDASWERDTPTSHGFLNNLSK